MIFLSRSVRKGLIEILSKTDTKNSADMNAAAVWLQHYIDKHEVIGGRITIGLRSYNKRAYDTWRSMVDRCTNKNHRYYHRYGGRGITVCDEWLTFENFFTDMGNPPDGLSLDRIDNDGGYSKANCRWASKYEQATNRSRTIYVVVDGVKMPLASVCKERGISYSTARTRIYKGYPIEVVLSTESYAGQRNVGTLKNAEVLQ